MCMTNGTIGIHCVNKSSTPAEIRQMRKPRANNYTYWAAGWGGEQSLQYNIEYTHAHACPFSQIVGTHCTYAKRMEWVEHFCLCISNFNGFCAVGVTEFCRSSVASTDVRVRTASHYHVIASCARSILPEHYLSRNGCIAHDHKLLGMWMRQRLHSHANPNCVRACKSSGACHHRSSHVVEQFLFISFDLGWNRFASPTQSAKEFAHGLVDFVPSLLDRCKAWCAIIIEPPINAYYRFFMRFRWCTWCRRILAYNLGYSPCLPSDTRTAEHKPSSSFMFMPNNEI